jgi:hypothetical protein
MRALLKDTAIFLISSLAFLNRLQTEGATGLVGPFGVETSPDCPFAANPVGFDVPLEHAAKFTTKKMKTNFILYPYSLLELQKLNHE